jgi:hypothetical protein
MIITDHFIYIHLHKSGGALINKCLKRYFSGARQLGSHLPCRLIPQAVRGLPVLGFVRDPWSYYVSWYSFQSSMPLGNPVFQCLSENGTLEFKQVIRNLLDLGSGGKKLDELLVSLPEAYTYKGPNLPRPAIEGIRNSRVGFYTYLYQYMYSGYSGSLHLGRTDSLAEDFLEFLVKFNVPVSDALRAYIDEHRDLMRPEPVQCGNYYDLELRDLVAERDQAVIRTFDYRFAA